VSSSQLPEPFTAMTAFFTHMKNLSPLLVSLPRGLFDLEDRSNGVHPLSSPLKPAAPKRRRRQELFG